MNFALLGTDDESVALVRATVAAGHSLVWIGDVGNEKWPIEQGGGLQDEGEDWETLYDTSAVDAVIVGRGRVDAAVRSMQVGQLAKSGVAILTTFPLVDSVLAYYEIDMARGESGAVLQHYNPLATSADISRECATWVAEGHPELGAIEQVVWQRPLAERTQERVLWHFSRDVELLSLVAGPLNRLGALGSPDEAATYAGLSVQLLGKSQVPVRWEVGPAEDWEGARLVLVGQLGKVSVAFDETGRPVELETRHEGDVQTRTLDAIELPAQAVARFVSAVQQGDGAASTWSDALRAMELTDTIEISLRRGRMIEVHQQQLTEQLAFKGTMSAVGCGVLMVLPPLLLFCGWVAELVGLPVAKYWPHALLLLLGLFLSVQVIPKLLFAGEQEK